MPEGIFGVMIFYYSILLRQMQIKLLKKIKKYDKISALLKKREEKG